MNKDLENYAKGLENLATSLKKLTDRMDQLFEIVEIDQYGNRSVLPMLFDAASARENRAELEVENPQNQYLVQLHI